MQQQCRTLVLVAVVAALAVGVSTTATASAQSWLRAHPAVQQDELAELKDVNPDAYAIVKALMTKRSLGLLDPRHPTASFAKPAAPTTPTEGASAFALSPEDEEASHKNGQAAPTAQAYPDAPVASSHDWLNWKPQDSATSDEAMVNNVLGAVANLAGSKKSTSNSDSTLATDEAAFGSDTAAPAATAAPAVAAAAPVSAGNSYLKDIDFGMSAPAATGSVKSAAIQGNSYLRGVDLAGKSDTDAPTGGSALASFSWDDDSKAQQHHEQAQPQQKASGKPDTALNAFSSWLSGSKKAASKVVQQAPAAPAAPAGNPYTAGLW